MPQRLVALAATHFSCAPAEIDSHPIQKGASGRTILRLRDQEKRSVIGIHNDGQRLENADFVRIGQWLHQGEVPVPELLALCDDCCLVEDLGNTDLMHFHATHDWSESRDIFFSVLEGLKQLHQLPLQPPFSLDRRFDSDTYGWEQDYFFEHLWATHLGRRKMPDLTPFRAIAQELGATQKVMVHRDFQSQNLMTRGGQAYFIDFQGLRPGHGEYDLASLLYDPYTGLEAPQRQELIEYWIGIGGSFDPHIFDLCAMQRLMQALGAFANISHNLGNDWYLQHIPPASESLKEILAKLGLASLDL